MKCTKCHKESSFLILVVLNRKKHTLCNTCVMKLNPKTNTITDIDRQITEVQDIIKNTENLLRKMEERNISENGDDIPAIKFTPGKLLVFIKGILTNLLKQKEDLLNTMSEKEKLSYRLNEAVRNENFQMAAKLRDKLNKHKLLDSEK